MNKKTLERMLLHSMKLCCALRSLPSHTVTTGAFLSPLKLHQRIESKKLCVPFLLPRPHSNPRCSLLKARSQSRAAAGPRPASMHLSQLSQLLAPFSLDFLDLSRNSSSCKNFPRTVKRPIVDCDTEEGPREGEAGFAEG